MSEKRNLRAPKGMCFEEFTAGQSATSAGRTVTEADVVGFAALSGDWTTIHTDAVYASQQPFGQRVAHGLLGLSIASALAARLGFLDGTVLAFREIDDWKFSLPIFFGDTIRVRVTVKDTKPLPRLGGGLVSFKVELLNQDNNVVQRGLWKLLMKSQGEEG